MSRAEPSSVPTSQSTLGPLAYAMPLMPAVLTFGPLFLVMHTSNLIAVVAAVVFGMGLAVLWMCLMRIAKRLDALAPAPGRSSHAKTDLTGRPPKPHGVPITRL